ncbi:exodeoxyribonuclease V subunit beta [Providencia hangzhouensis]|uniref:exodeoxyribonuclease V subunit beta n=1 Tax=Providencia TaxID=586 RepID=UPI000D947BD1|nr:MULTISPECIES: exodeoxyribonuclease V subunit beta [Providencia]MCK9789319.1 exodeoxyribonuclease V subunit beta [Providencia rettgeri]MDX7424340.1 exodeoxyribonuclease V subunit beta [Providencia sp. CIM-Carb-044]PYZ58324.1 exodeoxyribonuclease V subunit beta [Providencia rettgeri]QIF67044.1 exodeoxyribonuclease V subunit beta [Providencia sp. 1709051003]QNP18663.1 exodeoxyribonuclease V subunit beta [Providencia rettgeri]
MNKVQVESQLLNVFSLPLRGQRLIEASAGTGKTYTIGILYLRLLLGLGGVNAFPRPLSVEEILVVTFTEAATNELRGRIRQRIHDMRLVCLRNGVGFESQPEYLELLAELSGESQRKFAAQWLQAAERQMDEAAIYTIHGFCQRMLVHNAFESGVLFEQTMIQDEFPIQKQACADFWRRHFYPLNYSMTKVIQSLWTSPEALLSEIKPFLQGDIPLIINQPKQVETLEERHQRLILLIESVKTAWLENSADFEKLITDSDVDKRSYSTRFLPTWLIKIGEWAQEKTEDYQLPKDLERFSQTVLHKKSKSGLGPEHIVFQSIDELLSQSLTLKDLVIPLAISEVREAITNEKHNRGEMGFDDLLTRLDGALAQESGKFLAQAISQRFPVAMIDEFQDTDAQQYRIFQRIYREVNDSALLFIGDPKQAIYAFRGADIFTYIEAKNEVSAHYTLETNYRSSQNMVEAINHLFGRCQSPFIFEQIPFQPVNFAKQNSGKKLIHDGEVVKALTFWQVEAEGVSVAEYEQATASQCAAQIAQYLQGGFQGSSYFDNKGAHTPVEASDITVLVRSRREAVLIRDALNRLNIPSVFQSNRESVFSTPEARDLLWLLQAVLTPEKERVLRSALATGILGLTAKQIDDLNHDEKSWEKIVDEFARYGMVWQKRGVLPMLRMVMAQRQIAETLLSGADGERRLMDVMHIGELLQEMSLQLEGEHTLTRWLAQQIAHPDHQSDVQQMRLESDKHLVQISTIHKSKGLEYKIVWLPFASNFLPQSKGLYHDRTDYAVRLDLNDSEENVALADEERLAEDLRLLYVALTRAIYHCSVGIAPLIKGNRKKSGETDLHLSALGYVIQKGQAGDSLLLNDMLAEISNDVIDVAVINQPKSERVLLEQNDSVNLSARAVTRHFNDHWRVTSYSGLSYGSSHTESEESVSALQFANSLAPNMDIEASVDVEQQEDESLILTPHQFPKGASPGTFLHNLMEEIDFSGHVSQEWLSEKLESSGFDIQWAPMLQEWLHAIVQAPLSEDGLCLSALQAQDQLDEMQFYLPIDSLLSASHLDKITHQYDPLSQRCPPLNFERVQGILKGFIDLTFYWKGKFYLLDYKSNYLGKDASFYTQEAMAEAMIDHRYDLQYQLYLLALHRYLKQRMPNYDYETHFGGVYYLFLRGIDNIHSSNGIFFYRPIEPFIEALDSLFKNVQQGEAT